MEKVCPLCGGELKKEYCERNNIRLIVIPYNQEYSLKDLL